MPSSSRQVHPVDSAAELHLRVTDRKLILSCYPDVVRIAPVRGTTDYYVSDDGRAFSLRRRSVGAYVLRCNREGWIAPSSSQGVFAISLGAEVAAAFLAPQPSSLHVIDHIDGDRRNNRVSNLRWIERGEITRRRNAARRENVTNMTISEATELIRHHFPGDSELRFVPGLKHLVASRSGELFSLSFGGFDVIPTQCLGQVRIGPDQERFDRVFARTFLGPPPKDADFVAHMDGNEENNAADNLRWVAANRPSPRAILRLIDSQRLKEICASMGLSWGAEEDAEQVASTILRSRLTPLVSILDALTQEELIGLARTFRMHLDWTQPNYLIRRLLRRPEILARHMVVQEVFAEATSSLKGPVVLSESYPRMAFDVTGAGYSFSGAGVRPDKRTRLPDYLARWFDQCVQSLNSVPTRPREAWEIFARVRKVFPDAPTLYTVSTRPDLVVDRIGNVYAPIDEPVLVRTASPDAPLEIVRFCFPDVGRLAFLENTRRFAVSDDGRIFSVKPGVPICELRGKRLNVTLRLDDGSKKWMSVAHAVAKAFVPGFSEDKVAVSLDGDPHNARASNLVWKRESRPGRGRKRRSK